MDFTDLNLTAYGGSSTLAQTARQHGLFELLDEAVRVKVRNRDATDAETPWSMIASLARGNGADDARAAQRARSALCRRMAGTVAHARRHGSLGGVRRHANCNHKSRE